MAAVEKKIPNVSDPVKRQIMTQKYQTLRVNVLSLLITINLRMKYLMQRKKKRDWSLDMLLLSL